jgi:putative isomerase
MKTKSRRRFPYVLFTLVLVLSAVPPSRGGATGEAPRRLQVQPKGRSVKIGNFFSDAPYGIAFIVDDETGFLIDPQWDTRGAKTKYYARDAAAVPPGTTAPDFSFFQANFRHAGAEIRWTWGRSGPGAVAALIETDRPVVLSLKLPATWPRFHAIYTSTRDGLNGYGIAPRGAYVPFVLRTDPVPALVRANVKSEAEVVLELDPRHPTRFVAGIGDLPDLQGVEAILRAAGERYKSRRVAAEGSWGDFLGAIADNVNFSRLYGSDNARIAHSDGRGWWLQSIGGSPDLFPYFVWDFFFNALMAGLEDPEGARDTIRAVLSFQTPEGFIPSFSHWNAENGTYVTLHRSMPPVGAMCVWKMHTRRPDAAFLAEIYPSLARWHAWWPQERDGNRNGLLEYGSGQGWWQGAQYETGWDDNVHFERTAMVGTAMNADAVDLSSLWAMDAEYLAQIAEALGKRQDAARFRLEHKTMNKRINDRLWNESLGIYCSRLWDIPAEEGPALLTHVVFRGGLEAVFYKDWLFKTEAARRRDDIVDFDWGESGPVEEMNGDRWAARWTGSFQPPESGPYRFAVQADEGARLTIDGRLVLDTWSRTTGDRRTADITLEAGKPCPVVLEYFEDTGKASLHFTVHRLSPGKPGSDWLTRLTPMNFYPLICGAPDAERAGRVLSWMYREDKFWGLWLLPSVAYDDPVWYQQTYWRGHIWPPANYLLWQGIRRYADPAHQADFVRRSVGLFMRNWTTNRICGENYRSSDGGCGDHPHYTWGALLCMIGLEALADVGPDLKPSVRQDSGFMEDIVLRRVPFGGKLYRIEIGRGKGAAFIESDRSSVIDSRGFMRRDS